MSPNYESNMILIIYNKKAELKNKLLPISNIYEIEEELTERDNENHIIKTYNFFYPNFTPIEIENDINEDTFIYGYGQLAFKVEGLNPEIGGVFIDSKDDNKDLKLDYDPETQYFFERATFNKRKEGIIFNNSRLTFNQVGTIYPYIIKDNNRYNLNPIEILPSPLSLDEYRIMLADISQITMELIQQMSDSVVKFGTSGLYLIDELSENLHTLKQLIDKIDREKEADFRFNRQKIYRNKKGNRFDLPSEIANIMNPSNQYSFINKPIIDTHIYEHRMIKRFLNDMKYYLINLNDIILETDQRNIDSLIDLLPKKQEIDDKEWDKYKQYINEYNQNFINLQHSLTNKRLIRIVIEFKINQESFVPKIDTGNLRNLLEFSLFSRFVDKVWDLELVRYAYYIDIWKTINKDNTNNFSYKFTLNYTSNKIEDYYSLVSIFKNIQKGQTIKIDGIAFIDKNDAFKDDIIGKLPPNKDNEKQYKIYNFTLKVINRVRIDNVEIDLNFPEKELQENKVILLNMLLPERYSNYKLQQAINIKHDKLQENKFSIINYKDKIENNLILIENMLNHELFKNLLIDPSEKLVSTQRFSHTPSYQAIWKIIKSNEFVMSFLPGINTDLINVRDMNKIYETWVFFKIVEILVFQLKFEIVDKNNINSLVQKHFAIHKGKINLDKLSINFIKGNYQLTLTNTPVIKRKYNEETKIYEPDFQIKIAKNDTIFGSFCNKNVVIYLDAKNRNYKSQEPDQWDKDIKEVALNKYLFMETIENKEEATASFIIHSDATVNRNKHLTYNYLNAKVSIDDAQNLIGDSEKEKIASSYFYNNEEFSNHYNKEKIKAHNSGSVPLTPNYAYEFQNLLRMIMEYHLGEYKYCWNCGETRNITETELRTAGNNLKYHYQCNNCQEFWVKNHCAESGHPIIKHTLNYHQEVNANKPWMLICPNCFNGVKKN